MIFSGKRILIVGFGASGKSAYNLLKSNNNEILIYDDKMKSTHKNLVGNFDLAVISPGVFDDCLALNFIKQNNIPIIGEIELGALLCKSERVVGITGTNGKTTVVSLIQHILRFAGENAISCGNNGVCLTSVCARFEKQDACVLELSSFMLKKAKNLHFNIACFLNFQPDHLNFHKNIDDYFESKKNIFSFQNKKDVAILNADDEKVSQIKTKSETFYFSIEKKVKGVYLDKNYLWFNDGKMITKLFSTKSISLIGKFNIANVCASVLVCLLLKIEKSIIKNAVKTFIPVKHRMNIVDNKDFKIINDSKSTNVASCLASLSCFNKNVILILGGSDKGECFDRLFKEIKTKCKFVVLMGEMGKKLKYYAVKNDFTKYKNFKSFKKAVRFALKIAAVNDVVLFSPACASFDKFNNFEQRGEFFEKLVERYVGKKQNK